MRTRTSGGAAVDARVVSGRVVASIALSVGLCFVLGRMLGAAWVDMIQQFYEPGSDDADCWGCYRLMSTETVYLHLSCILLAVVPAAVVGHSPSPRRRLGLAGLIGGIAGAAFVGFVFSTGIGGRLGFPEDDVLFGVVGALLTVSIGAVFGYEVGSLARRRGQAPRPPIRELVILVGLGILALLAAVLVLLVFVDAILLQEA